MGGPLVGVRIIDGLHDERRACLRAPRREWPPELHSLAGRCSEDVLAVVGGFWRREDGLAGDAHGDLP